MPCLSQNEAYGQLGFSKALGTSGQNTGEDERALSTPLPCKSRLGRRREGRQLLVRLGELFLSLVSNKSFRALTS